jgi:conjugal transfer pilus assembly protein TraV
MKKYLSLLALLGTMIFLSGCSSMNNKFDCPRAGGVMCKSLDDVNRMVDNGEIERINQTNVVPTAISKEKAIPTPDVGNTPYPIKTLHPGKPLRQHETVMRVWIAPYEDNQGNYHQDTTVFKVIKPGAWIGKPVNAVTDEG